MAGMSVQQMMLVGSCTCKAILDTEWVTIKDAQEAICHASLMELDFSTLVEQLAAVKQVFFL